MVLILHDRGGMTPSELKARTKEFSDRIVVFCKPLLHRLDTRDMADQLMRSGTAVDANYGSAQCARSRREFRSKIGQVLDDAQESHGHLQRLLETELVNKTKEAEWLCNEADELTRIFRSSFQTASKPQKRPGDGKPGPPPNPV